MSDSDKGIDIVGFEGPQDESSVSSPNRFSSSGFFPYATEVQSSGLDDMKLARCISQINRPIDTRTISETDEGSTDLCEVIVKRSRTNNEDENAEIFMSDSSDDESGKMAEWRFGPSKHWYDLLNVNENGSNLDYGFRKRKYSESLEKVDEVAKKFPKDCFQMICSYRWEDDVIWNGDQVRRQILNLDRIKNIPAAWIPNSIIRSYSSFIYHLKKAEHNRNRSSFESDDINMTMKDISRSIFKPQNPVVADGSWVKDIIWDSENMDEIPKPPFLEMYKGDPNTIFEIPTDASPERSATSQEREDSFNLSNDIYYTQEAADLFRTPTKLQHSVPAMNLNKCLFPIEPDNEVLDYYRRQLRPIRPRMNDEEATTVIPLFRHVEEKQQEIRNMAKETYGGEVFVMNRLVDLSGFDGSLFLMEYVEENPPLLSRVGMASNIRIYYKKQCNKDDDYIPSYAFGELAPTERSPFLGNLKEGEFVPTLENNMYLAPIFQQFKNFCDFLIIKRDNHYHIRDFDEIFTVGQECPKIQVPRPKSKTIQRFLTHLAHFHICKLFRQSRDTPPCLKLEDVSKLVPNLSEITLRKYIKSYAYFVKKDNGCYWALKEDVYLPELENFTQYITPELFCAYYSQSAYHSRLRAAGYEGDGLLSIDDDTAFESRIIAAPWNTTSAYTSAVNKECLLELRSTLESIETNKGIPYVKLSKRPSALRDHFGGKFQNYTDEAILEKVISTIEIVLKRCQKKPRRIEELMKWNAIKLIKILSTLKLDDAKSSVLSEFKQLVKQTNLRENEIFEEECRKEFEMQYRSLASTDIVSTDSDSSSDSELKEYAKELEQDFTEENSPFFLDTNNATKKKKVLKIVRTFIDEEGNLYSTAEFVREANVIEMYINAKSKKETESILGRNETPKCLNSDENNNGEKEIFSEDSTISDRIEHSLQWDKENSNSRKLIKVQNATVKICKKLLKRAKEFSRRKSLAKSNMSAVIKKRKMAVAERRKTNPFVIMSLIFEEIVDSIAKLDDVLPFLQPIDRVLNPSYYLYIKEPMDIHTIRLKLRDNKYHSRKTFISDFNQMVLNSIRFNGSASPITNIARKMLDYCIQRIAEKDDYLMELEKWIPYPKKSHLSQFESILKKITNDMKNIEGSEAFRRPVNKIWSLYYDVIKTPMDLLAITIKIRRHKYKNRRDFIKDVKLILDNSVTFNGEDSDLTATANNIYTTALNALEEHSEELTILEEEIIKSEARKRSRKSLNIDPSISNESTNSYEIRVPDFHMNKSEITSVNNNPIPIENDKGQLTACNLVERLGLELSTNSKASNKLDERGFSDFLTQGAFNVLDPPKESNDTVELDKSSTSETPHEDNSNSLFNIGDQELGVIFLDEAEFDSDGNYSASGSHATWAGRFRESIPVTSGNAANLYESLTPEGADSCDSSSDLEDDVNNSVYDWGWTRESPKSKESISHIEEISGTDSSDFNTEPTNLTNYGQPNINFEETNSSPFPSPSSQAFTQSEDDQSSSGYNFVATDTVGILIQDGSSSSEDEVVRRIQPETIDVTTLYSDSEPSSEDGDTSKSSIECIDLTDCL
ncbi:DgyrCDS528 [Dimorphilus gyrociliatus]|uniref:DgyrCDS528 n=1 Tax=Dimorphilus gyrociliatus TaxID=2664684 RepID=A0A7I8V4P8_9ANNE|nr:DgyrCDS528 [Dimorphilus gyrociliatus]